MGGEFFCAAQCIGDFIFKAHFPACVGIYACRLDGGAKAVSAKLGELWKELSKEERDHWIEVARVQSEKNEKEKPVEKVC